MSNVKFKRKTVELSEVTHGNLDKISKHRKNAGEVITKSKDIVAQLILDELKRIS